MTLGLKYTPEKWLENLNFSFGEKPAAKEKPSVPKKQGKAKKSELERLLDE